jgi:tetratricopeptide (TPR) repeat protein
MPVVLTSVLVLSLLFTPFLGAKASPGGERVTFDLEQPKCTLSFELPPGYQVAQQSSWNGIANGPLVYRTETREGKSQVYEWGADALHFDIHAELVGTDEQHPADPQTLLKGGLTNSEGVFQEGSVDVMGEGGITYPGYYVLIHTPAEPGQHGMFAETVGALVVLLESKGIGAVYFSVSFLDNEDHTIDSVTVTYSVDGQSPITKHKADVAAVVASVRISYQPQEPIQIPSIPAAPEEETVPPEEQTSTVISQPQGEAYTKESSSSEWKPISPATEVITLSEGSAVRTDKRSIRLKDLPNQGDRVSVGENTEVKIQERTQLLYKAADLYFAGQYKEAKKTVEEFLVLEPESEYGQLLLNRIKAVLEVMGGIVTTPAASSWTPESAGLFYKAADLYIEGKYEEAQETIKKFLILEPGDDNGQKLLARIENVLKIIEGKTLYYEAIQQYRRGEWEEARETLKKYLATNQTDQMAIEILVEIESKLNMSAFSTKESRDFYYEAIKEYAAGGLEKAVAALKNCLAIDPANYAALQILDLCEPLKPEKLGSIIDLLVGKIRAFIVSLEPGSQFEVRTPVCHSGVRGTDFIVDTTSDRTEVLVFEGTVELSDLERHKTVLVKAGESSIVVAGGLPSEPKGFDSDTVSKKYLSLFESEEEMKAVVGDMQKQIKDKEGGGFPFYLLAIPAVIVAVVITLLMMRRRRRA